jgi:hypothetical protein
MLFLSSTVSRLSPDGTLLCCGTTPARQQTEAKSLLCFFEVAGAAVEPVLKIGVAAGGVSVVMVKWQKETNQILCR